MPYTAIVCRLRNVREHPNADRLKLATVQGYQVIIGLEQKEDDLGVFFPCDGMIVRNHLLHNNLYRKHPDNQEPMGGYFGPRGRVKATKLRGEISEGFWEPIESLSWSGPVFGLKDGDLIDSVNDHKLCQKYYTPATLKAINKAKNKKGKSNNPQVDRSMLHEHYSTGQIRHQINRIPKNSVLYITEKLHGSSGRTGRIKSVYPLSKFKRAWNKIMPVQFNHEQWEYVSGSRRVVIDPYKEYQGFYKGDPFRKKIHERIAQVGLHKGEILYYEIVGFTESGASIMPPHGLTDKKLIKQYGDLNTYVYGCEQPECKIFVYRIAQATEDGSQIDLPWVQVESRCKILGLDPVPLLAGPIIYEDKDDLLDLVRDLSDGPSILDDSHIREGVVVRIEHSDMFVNLKWKGATFCELEGIRKNDPEYVDPEEVS